MRVWLDTTKLVAVQLMPSNVQSAIQAQNTDVSAGQIGALPAIKGQMLNATVRAKSRLQTAAQFRDIVVQTNTDGSVVRLELGADDYLTKPFEPRELLARIRNLLCRAPRESAEPKLARFGRWRLDLVKRRLLAADDSVVMLSSAEFDILFR